MKNLLKSLAILFVLAIVFTSCEDKADQITVQNITAADTTNPNYNINNNGNLPNGKVLIDYVVSVYDVTSTDPTKPSPLPLSATNVRIQSNGQTFAANTDGNGLATFRGLAPGIITGTITKGNYTTIRFTADLDPKRFAMGDSNFVSTGSSVIYTYGKTATLSGEFVGSYTLSSALSTQTQVIDKRINLGLDPNPSATASEISRAIPVSLTYSVNENYPFGEGLGKLTSVIVEGAEYYIEATNSGLTNNPLIRGAFSIDEVPNTHSTLDAYLTVSPLSLTIGSATNSTQRTFSYGPEKISVRGNNVGLGYLYVVRQ